VMTSILGTSSKTHRVKGTDSDGEHRRVSRCCPMLASYLS
jgi:hypothetical protein